MPEWRWKIGPHTGTDPQYDLAKTSGRKVTWSRTDGPTGNFATSNERLRTAVHELITDMWLFCDAATVFRGRVASRGRAGNENLRITHTFTAGGYKTLLHRRDINDADTISWASATDPADAAWTIIQQAQARPGGNLGIVRGVHPGTASTLTGLAVDQASAVDDAINKLAGLAPGFDWDITSTSATGLQLDVWRPGRGDDRGVVVDYGGVASSYTSTADPSAYVNSYRVSGQAPSGGGSAPAPVRVDAADITTRPEGRFDGGETSQLTTTAALTALANQGLANAQNYVPSWQVVLRRGWWQGPTHLFIGDPVLWVCRPEGVVETLTVEQIDAEWTNASAREKQWFAQRGLNVPSGEPKVTLTIGAPPKTARFRQRTIDRRLKALENR